MCPPVLAQRSEGLRDAAPGLVIAAHTKNVALFCHCCSREPGRGGSSRPPGRKQPCFGQRQLPFPCPCRLPSPGQGPLLPAQLRVAVGHSEGSGAGASALCPSPGRGKEAVSSVTENEISGPKRKKKGGEKRLVSKLKEKTLGGGVFFVA